MVRRWLAVTNEAPAVARVPPSRTERRSGVERRSLHERRQARPTGAVERIHEATGRRSGEDRRSGPDRRKELSDSAQGSRTWP